MYSDGVWSRSIRIGEVLLYIITNVLHCFGFTAGREKLTWSNSRVKTTDLELVSDVNLITSLEYLSDC